MGTWIGEAGRTIGFSLAISTEDLTTGPFPFFEEFKKVIELHPTVESHPTVEQLMLYCVTIKAKGLSVKTIRGHLAAIFFWAKPCRLTDCTSEFRIWKMLEVWKRESGQLCDNSQPISPDI